MASKEVIKAYNRERARVSKFISRAEKRGYMFKENILPDRPKNITKASVNRLKKLTPDELYKKSVYGGSETGGEIVKGTEGRKLERSASAKKASKTRKIKKFAEKESKKQGFRPFEDGAKQNQDRYARRDAPEDYFVKSVIEGYRARIDSFPDSCYRGKIKLNAWLDAQIAGNGELAVSKMLEDAAENGVILTEEILYKDELLQLYMMDMLNWLPDVEDGFADEIMDEFETLEDFEIPF